MSRDYCQAGYFVKDTAIGRDEYDDIYYEEVYRRWCPIKGYISGPKLYMHRKPNDFLSYEHSFSVNNFTLPAAQLLRLSKATGYDYLRDNKYTMVLAVCPSRREIFIPKH